MNSSLHHTVVMARLADLRRTADNERAFPRARSAPVLPHRPRRALRRLVRAVV